MKTYRKIPNIFEAAKLYDKNGDIIKCKCKCKWREAKEWNN